MLPNFLSTAITENKKPSRRSTIGSCLLIDLSDWNLVSSFRKVGLQTEIGLTFLAG